MTYSPPHEPHSRVEWQEAVDAASFALVLHSALSYGLVELVDGHGVKRGPECIDVERCTDLLERGRAAGVFPGRNPGKNFSSPTGSERSGRGSR